MHKINLDKLLQGRQPGKTPDPLLHHPFFLILSRSGGLVELIEPLDIFNEGNRPVRKGKLLDEVFRVASMEG